MEENVNNKTIARNTLYLYGRMFFTMWLTLYISRFLLQVLGVRDYGIYSVVGSFAVLFSFISTSFLLSTERYIAAAIPSDNKEVLQRTFSTCLHCHIVIALLIFVLLETVGLWFLNNKMDIPQNRLMAANIVFHATAVSCSVATAGLPFHACVVAYEKMSFYAFIGIMDVLLKLMVIIVVYFVGGDSLVIYGVLFSLIAFFDVIAYGLYCHFRLENIAYQRCWDAKLFREVFCFVGWNIIKQGSYVGFTQGANLLFNLYGGVLLNAAYGLAMQVHGACMAFMHNVQSAFFPQIIKKCASKQYDALHLLIRRAAKFSNFMLLFIMIPLLLNMEYILKLWLGVVPEYASQFSKVLLFSCLLETFIEPLNTAILAHGNVRNYQVTSAISWIVALLLMYAFLCFGQSAYHALMVRLIAQLVISIYSFFYLRQVLGLPVKNIITHECLQAVVILLICLLLPYYTTSVIGGTEWTRLIVSTTLSTVVLVICIASIGLTRSERLYVASLIRERIEKW